MTPQATSGRRLLMFEKRPKMPPPTAFGQILVARRLACSTNWWASCFVIMAAAINIAVFSVSSVNISTYGCSSWQIYNMGQSWDNDNAAGT